MKTRLFALMASAALVGAPVALHAQTTMDGTGPSRFTVDLQLAQYSLESDVADQRTGVGGVAARVMFRRGDVANALNTLFYRARFGGYLVYTAEQKDNDVRSFNFGAQADFPLFAMPVANGFLDPFVSLGAGLFNTRARVAGGVTAPEGTAYSSTDFVLTPGIGTMIPITGGLRFRGDIQDAIVFGGETNNNWLLAGGISIGF